MIFCTAKNGLLSGHLLLLYQLQFPPFIINLYFIYSSVLNWTNTFEQLWITPDISKSDWWHVLIRFVCPTCNSFNFVKTGIDSVLLKVTQCYEMNCFPITSKVWSWWKLKDHFSILFEDVRGNLLKRMTMLFSICKWNELCGLYILVGSENHHSTNTTNFSLGLMKWMSHYFFPYSSLFSP